MKVSDVYGGQYLKAIMIGENRYRFEIKKVVEELVGQEEDRKIVLYFTATEKGLVLNATNANTLAAAYGDDTNSWAGKVLTLFTEWTEYGGNRMKGLRVSCEPAAHDEPAPARAGPVTTNPVQGTPPWEKTTTQTEEPVYEDELEPPDDSLPF